MRVLPSFVFAVASLSLVACGGDDGGTTIPIDGTPGVDAAIDGQPIDSGPVPCTISTPTFGDVGALTATAYYIAGKTPTSPYRISFIADLETTMPTDIFFFDIFTGYEPFGTQSAPTPAIAGTYNIVNNQLQYADCSVCLTLGSNSNGDTYEDDFMATGGSVTISEVGTAAGQNLTLEFINLRYEQVTFEGATSIPVGNGCVTAIANATFTGVMMTPPANLQQGPQLLRPHTSAKRAN